jgi:hypothetical protein
MMAQKCGTQRFLIFFEISQLTSRMPWVELPLNKSWTPAVGGMDTSPISPLIET